MLVEWSKAWSCIDSEEEKQSKRHNFNEENDWLACWPRNRCDGGARCLWRDPALCCDNVEGRSIYLLLDSLLGSVSCQQHGWFCHHSRGRWNSAVCIHDIPQDSSSCDLFSYGHTRFSDSFLCWQLWRPIVTCRAWFVGWWEGDFRQCATDCALSHRVPDYPVLLCKWESKVHRLLYRWWHFGESETEGMELQCFGSRCWMTSSLTVVLPAVWWSWIATLMLTTLLLFTQMVWSLQLLLDQRPIRCQQEGQWSTHLLLVCWWRLFVRTHFLSARCCFLIVLFYASKCRWRVDVLLPSVLMVSLKKTWIEETRWSLHYRGVLIDRFVHQSIPFPLYRLMTVIMTGLGVWGKDCTGIRLHHQW